jgi:hypothetical protein
MPLQENGCSSRHRSAGNLLWLLQTVDLGILAQT